MNPIHKGATQALAGIAAMLLRTPDSVRSLMSILLVAMLLDFISGLMVAAFQGNVRSRTARLETVAKCCNYFMLLGVAALTSWAMGAWKPLEGCIGICIAAEVLSNIENAIKMQKYSRINLGMFAPVLDSARKYFAVDKDEEAAKMAAPLVVKETVIMDKPQTPAD